MKVDVSLNHCRRSFSVDCEVGVGVSKTWASRNYQLASVWVCSSWALPLCCTYVKLEIHAFKVSRSIKSLSPEKIHEPLPLCIDAVQLFLNMICTV